jgi:transposase-like protein
MPAPMASVPSFAQLAHRGPVVITCPSCVSFDVKVRSARGRISYLYCHTCGESFKETRAIIRTLSVAP